MAKGILIAAMDFSAAPEDEFHDWYDLEHIPERLATAFDSLYASLSDTQKQATDTLFRQQSTAAAQPRTRR